MAPRLAFLKRERNKVLQTPIIVLTVHAQKRVAMEALAEGAQDFLSKGPGHAPIALKEQYVTPYSEISCTRNCSGAKSANEESESFVLQESIIEFETVSPPAVKESTHTFDSFVNEYAAALAKAMEEMSFKVPLQVPDQMRTLAEKLGEIHAGPKDVIDIHTSALRHSVEGKSKSVEEAMTNESRIILVQLMGYLCRYYRNRNLS